MFLPSQEIPGRLWAPDSSPSKIKSQSLDQHRLVQANGPEQRYLRSYHLELENRI